MAAHCGMACNCNYSSSEKVFKREEKLSIWHWLWECRFLCTKICCLSGSNGAEPWSMHNPVLTQIVFGDRLRELADVQLPRTAAGLTFNGSDKLKFHLNFKFWGILSFYVKLAWWIHFQKTRFIKCIWTTTEPFKQTTRNQERNTFLCRPVHDS